MHNIGCVLISNTDDFRFLKVTLRECAGVFTKIVVSIGSQLWNGEAENEEEIATFITENSYDNVEYVRYQIPQDKMKVIGDTVKPEMYWESHARWIAFDKLGDVSYVLFLDSDEVIDVQSFSTWLDTNEYQRYAGMKLKNYWYWRDPIYRARGYYEDSAVLVKKNTFNPLHIFSNMGRHGVFEGCVGQKKRNVSGFNDLPLIHHYSWVRTKDQMLRKVRAWGHRSDRLNWEALVEKEFSRPFDGTDFVKGLQYDIVDNTFGL